MARRLAIPRHNVRRGVLAGALAAFTVLAPTSCSTGSGGLPRSSATVVMTEYRFTPADIAVPGGASVTLVNQGALVHSWILQKAGVGTAGVAPGTTSQLDLSDVSPGRYVVFCDQPGHIAAGQIGTVTIAR